VVTTCRMTFLTSCREVVTGQVKLVLLGEGRTSFRVRQYEDTSLIYCELTIPDYLFGFGSLIKRERSGPFAAIAKSLKCAVVV